MKKALLSVLSVLAFLCSANATSNIWRKIPPTSYVVTHEEDTLARSQLSTHAADAIKHITSDERVKWDSVATTLLQSNGTLRVYNPYSYLQWLSLDDDIPSVHKRTNYFDMEKWTDGTTTILYPVLCAAAASDDYNNFIAGTSGNGIYNQGTGSIWSRYQSIQTNSFPLATYGNHIFVTIDSTLSKSCASYENGFNWKYSTHKISTNALAFHPPNTFLAGGTNATGIMLSFTGTNWTQSAKTTGNLIAIASSNTSSNGLIIASFESSGLWKSADAGTNWTQTADTSSSHTILAYRDGLFIASGIHDTGYSISTNGDNWQTYPYTNLTFTSLAAGTPGFIGVAKESPFPVYSHNGYNWTRIPQMPVYEGGPIITSTNTAAYDVFAYGLGMWVAFSSKQSPSPSVHTTGESNYTETVSEVFMKQQADRNTIDLLATVSASISASTSSVTAQIASRITEAQATSTARILSDSATPDAFLTIDNGTTTVHRITHASNWWLRVTAPVYDGATLIQPATNILTTLPWPLTAGTFGPVSASHSGSTFALYATLGGITFPTASGASVPSNDTHEAIAFSGNFTGTAALTLAAAATTNATPQTTPPEADPVALAALAAYTNSVPQGPTIALWGTNGTEFCTLEPGNMITQWRIETVNAWTLSTTGLTIDAAPYLPALTNIPFTATPQVITEGGGLYADAPLSDLRLFNFEGTIYVQKGVGSEPAWRTTDLYQNGDTSITLDTTSGGAGGVIYLRWISKATNIVTTSGLTLNDVNLTGTATLNGADLATRAAPALITYTNALGPVTLTNVYEAPIYLHATGEVSIAFSGLRAYMPLYLTVRSPDAPTWPTNTYFVGYGAFQTNRLNHFGVLWQSPELLVTPITTTE